MPTPLVVAAAARVAVKTPAGKMHRTRGEANTKSIDLLAQQFQTLAEADAEYWAFENKADRDLVHDLLHYPAMMVPRLQRELMAECASWDPGIQTIFDPFVGSGTVLTEAMLLGKDFVGMDINPLAVLACRAKSELFDIGLLRRELRLLLSNIHADRSSSIDVTFTNRDKWFTEGVCVGLSKLRRAILNRRNPQVRRFWWVALAETVRLTSNSRTSTVKLHLRPESEIENRPDPIVRFEELAARNITMLEEKQRLLAERQLLSEDRYVHEVAVRVGDCRATADREHDLLVTSPPYGDNHTTVTYGQASYLALQWIARSDIGQKVPDDAFVNTHALDTASLGGSRKDAMVGAEPALDRSAALRRTIDQLRDQPRDRPTRVCAFFRDFDKALDAILPQIRSGGLMIWTVGDRSVGGLRVPFAPILRQLIGPRAELVTLIDRRIPSSSKTMPTRNSVTTTMATENIVILRKRDAS